MRTGIIATTILAVSLLIFLAGCGGGGVEYVYEDEWDYPQYKYVSIYLRVEAPDGGPLGGATVFIEGEPVDGLTAPRWYRIGPDGPAEWRGWLHNWALNDYPVRIARPDQVRRLRVEVSKPGWGSDWTVIRIADSDPTYIYVRSTFTLGVGTLQSKKGTVQPEYIRPMTKTAK